MADSERAKRIREAIGAEAEQARKIEVHSVRLTHAEGDEVEQACIQTKTTITEFMHDAVIRRVREVLSSDE